MLRLARSLAPALLLAALAGADGTHLGSNYCTATPNSSGGAAGIEIFGPDHGGTGLVFLDDPVVLSAFPVPSQTIGLFLYGTAPEQVPFGNGYLCVTGAVTRLPGLVATPGGVLSQNLTFSDQPDITPGPWYCQAWFRDQAAGGAKFDLSDGIALRISP